MPKIERLLTGSPNEITTTVIEISDKKPASRQASQCYDASSGVGSTTEVLGSVGVMRWPDSCILLAFKPTVFPLNLVLISSIFRLHSNNAFLKD